MFRGGNRERLQPLVREPAIAPEAVMAVAPPSSKRTMSTLRMLRTPATTSTGSQPTSRDAATGGDAVLSGRLETPVRP